MDQLTQYVSSINSVLWGVYGLIPLLVGAGIYFTWRFRFVQVRHFMHAIKYVFRGVSFFGKKADKEGMSSFQSLTTAVAAQVGTGNLQVLPPQLHWAVPVPFFGCGLQPSLVWPQSS